MKRLAVAVLFVALVGACGSEKPKLAAPTGTTAATSFTPQASAATTNPPLLPADSATPAAGGCSNAHDGFADIKLNADVPSPRCTIVHSSDELRFSNSTDGPVDVDTGFSQVTLAPHETSIVGGAVGQYWAPGVHRVKTSLYSGSGPEVWLQI